MSVFFVSNRPPPSGMDWKVLAINAEYLCIGTGSANPPFTAQAANFEAIFVWV